MPAFFSRISYSFGNEDFETERKALQLEPSSRVLCITASGDRPLHLLLDSCDEIISIDANPIQNFLLRLKSQAMEKLDFHEYLSFLGARPGNNRKDQLKIVIKDLEDETKNYWLNNQHLIEKGILYQGALEQMSKKIVSPLCHKIHGKKLKSLFSFDSLSEQQEFIKNKWDSRFLRSVFNVGVPLLARFVLKDPGIYSHPSSNLKPSKYVYQRLNNCLMNHLAKKNALFSLLFKGEVLEEAFPPYLQEEGVNKIKKNLSKITSHSIDLIQYLEQSPDNSFDRFSLSDVASYLSAEQFNRLMKAVYRTARPNARFSIREVLSLHNIPKELQPYFKREPELEQQMELEDRCFVYRFMIGSILK